MKISTKAILLVVIIVFIDQLSKTLVKNYMYPGQYIPIIGNWFKIYFIENPGMAFGMILKIKYGKLLLTTLRIIFSIVFSIVIRNLIEANKSKYIVFSLCLILAGAIGNVIDSIFYGVIYNYAPLMHGMVVDMLYFPIIDTYLPDWLPIWGGERFLFFSPIFNFADSSITIGIIIFAILYNKESKLNSKKAQNLKT
ncbi:MAG: lipoprotein signal peptidase [Solitalea-like symbiont of Acarus siro]